MNLKEAATALSKKMHDEYWRGEHTYAVGFAEHDPAEGIEDYLHIYVQNRKMLRTVKVKFLDKEGFFEGFVTDTLKSEETSKNL